MQQFQVLFPWELNFLIQPHTIILLFPLLLQSSITVPNLHRECLVASLQKCPNVHRGGPLSFTQCDCSNVASPSRIFNCSQRPFFQSIHQMSIRRLLFEMFRQQLKHHVCNHRAICFKPEATNKYTINK